MRVLVTGSTGFIGRHVCRALEPDHEVFRGSRGGHGPAGSACRLNLRETQEVRRVLQQIRPEAIIHCAGNVDAAAGYRTNARLTDNLLSEAIRHRPGTRTVVICSSASIYGFDETLPVPERARLRPVGGYGRGKVLEEQVAMAYRRRGLSVSAARIFNGVGAGMPSRLLVPQLLQQISEWGAGRRSTIEVTQLDAERDYIGARDVAAALVRLALGQPRYFAYNVGSGAGVSTRVLIEDLLRLTGRRRPLLVQSQLAEQPTKSYADITRLRTEFGWHPAVSLDEALMEAING